jgi:hypothetical protein
MKSVATLGLDIAKPTFQVHGVTRLVVQYFGGSLNAAR